MQPRYHEAISANATTRLQGLHIVANLTSEKGRLLVSSTEFKSFIGERIRHYGLTQVGEVFYDFPNGGFTAVVCLTESHLSIHTWPEESYLTFDVFLSNYLKDNRNITRSVYEDVKKFFEGHVTFEQVINR